MPRCCSLIVRGLEWCCCRPERCLNAARSNYTLHTLHTVAHRALLGWNECQLPCSIRLVQCKAPSAMKGAADKHMFHRKNAGVLVFSRHPIAPCKRETGREQTAQGRAAGLRACPPPLMHRRHLQRECLAALRDGYAFQAAARRTRRSTSSALPVTGQAVRLQSNNGDDAEAAPGNTNEIIQQVERLLEMEVEESVSFREALEALCSQQAKALQEMQQEHQAVLQQHQVCVHARAGGMQCCDGGDT
jgi:hypothetical protein